MPDYKKDFRINHQIRISPVVVIADGKNLGSMSTSAALKLAEESGLDLVEITPDARPPVCRLMDYGKFKYEKGVKEKQQKKGVRASQLKEIRLRPVTQDHDLDTKARAAHEFLVSGHPVQVTIKFKAREITHKELGFEVIQDILEKVSGVGKLRGNPSLQGKTLTCLIDPLK
jgi:translation initiation factor IF-3